MQSMDEIRTQSAKEDAILDSCLYYTQKVPTRRNFAYLLLEQAIYASNSGKSLFALANCYAAMNLYKKKDPYLAYRIYEIMAVIYSHQEKDIPALRYNKKALEMALQDGRKSDPPQAYFFLAQFYVYFYLDKLSDYTLRKINLSATGFDLKTDYYRTLAEHLMDSKRYNAAIAALDSSLIYSRLLNRTQLYFFQNSIYHYYGEIYLRLKKFDKARRFYDKSLSFNKYINSPNMTYINYVGLCKIALKENKFSQARHYLNLMRTVNNKNYYNSVKNKYYGLWGEYYFKQGMYDSALVQYRLAHHFLSRKLEHITSARIRIKYSLHLNRIYKRQAICYYENGAGQSTGYDSLLKAIQWSHASEYTANKFYRHKIPDEKYRAYERALGALQKKILFNTIKGPETENWKCLQESRFELVAHFMDLPDTLDHAISLPRLTIPKIQQKLKTLNSGMLFYLMDTEKSIGLYVAPDTVLLLPLQGGRELYRSLRDKLLRGLQRRAALDSIHFEAAAAHRLFRLLIEPFEKKIRLKKNLIIMPDESIAGLPFDLLPRQKTGKDFYLPTEAAVYWPKLLLQKYNISYSPYLSFLDRKPALHMRPPQMAVFSQPQNNPPQKNNPIAGQSGWNLTPLLYAAFEAQQIKKTWGPTTIFKGRSANIQTYEKRAGSFDLLHFATHAFADTIENDYSGLLLSALPDSSDDGLLMGYEIAGIPLDCELATLSACETGRGRIVEGEGIMGLPRVFIRAGTHAVLVTGWDIDDRYSAYLMPRFYRALLDKGQNKAIALANAKRETGLDKKVNKGRYDYRHPVFWAAYNLYGDPAPIRYFPLLPVLFFVAVATLIFLFILYRKRRG